MITLKNGNAISPACDAKNSNSISSISGKLTTLGLIFVESKDWTKAEIG